MNQAFRRITYFIIGLFLFFIQNIAFAGEDLHCTELDNFTNLTYLMVDRSGGPTSNANLKRTFSITKQDISKKKSGERLIIGAITGKAGDTRSLMDRVKPENSFTESAMKLRKKRNLFKNCIDNSLEEFIQETESHKNSAILETLKFVSEVFRSNSAKQKRLIIYSDMIQNSQALSFYGKRIKLFGKPTNKSPETFIAVLKKNHMMPNFKDTKVFIAGTGGTVSDQRALLVERFWRAYFKDSGAELRFYGPLLTGL